MPSAANLMSVGLPAPVANALGFDSPSAALTATGTVQGDALVLTSDWAVFGTVGANTGALLPARDGESIVINGGANPLKVYPPVGGTINGGAANAAFSVTNAKAAMFITNGTAIAAFLSA